MVLLRSLVYCITFSIKYVTVWGYTIVVKLWEGGRLFWLSVWHGCGRREEEGGSATRHVERVRKTF